MRFFNMEISTHTGVTWKDRRLSKDRLRPFSKETRRLPKREYESRVTPHHGNRDCMEKLSFEKKPMVKK